MYQVSDQIFQELIDKAIDSLPRTHTKAVENVAILFDDLPSEEQRINSNLNPFQTLLGLYEGVPLSQRQGASKIMPDKITLFKIPLENISNDEKNLYSNIRHTIWHEMAHYFGLNHKQISELE